MSGKLDQSLDEILTARRSTGRGRGRPRRNPAGRVAPVGGVGKNAARAAAKPTASKASAKPAIIGTDTKIIVSNLPADVTEAQIKEYFGKSIGSVKKATITYGPNGQSRGIATIIFSKPGTANEAATKLNGLLVDKRPMKVEVVVDALRAPLTEVKSMGDRVSKGKSQPKQAAAAKPAASTTARTAGRGAARGARRRGRNAGRGKPKTAEELDAEMTDYFVGGNTANASANTGTAGAANGAQAAETMDEIS